MLRIWIFLSIVFANVTAGSFRLALRITLFHYDVLKSRIADAFIASMFATYEPIHNEFVALFNSWKVLLGIQKSKTLTVEKLLNDLRSVKISKWIAAVLVAYDKDSEEYKALIPNGSSPFQTGTQSERLQAIKQLSEAIGSNPLLATLKSDVDTCYSTLDKAMQEQKGAISAALTASKTLEASRIKMCKAQYGNLGLLMNHFVDNTLLIADFFDLKAIRSHIQLIYEGHVNSLSVHTILEHTFGADDKLSLENDGVTELRFYLAAEKDAAIGATFITLAAAETKLVKASDLGDVSTMHFLIVYNPDAINKGEFTVELK